VLLARAGAAAQLHPVGSRQDAHRTIGETDDVVVHADDLDVEDVEEVEVVRHGNEDGDLLGRFRAAFVELERVLAAGQPRDRRDGDEDADCSEPPTRARRSPHRFTLPPKGSAGD
jgi:hypothetical protein